MATSFQISKGIMPREYFTLYHEQHDGFPAYHDMQRLRMLRWAAWIVRRYQPRTRRQTWTMLRYFAEMETRAIRYREPLRAEKKLLADVCFRLWGARTSVEKWSVPELELEELSPPMAASLAIRRIANGSGEILSESAIDETKRVMERAGDESPLSPIWNKTIIAALIASHVALHTSYVETTQRAAQWNDEAAVLIAQKDEEIQRLTAQLREVGIRPLAIARSA